MEGELDRKWENKGRKKEKRKKELYLINTYCYLLSQGS